MNIIEGSDDTLEGSDDTLEGSDDKLVVTFTFRDIEKKDDKFSIGRATKTTVSYDGKIFTRTGKETDFEEKHPDGGRKRTSKRGGKSRKKTAKRKNRKSK